MKSEQSRQIPSLIFEGMTSIRSVIKGCEGNDRRIIRVLVDKDKEKSKSREIAYLRAVSNEYGFTVEACESEKIDSLCVGNSHGGIICECTDRTIPDLSADIIKPDGFYVMIEGIEDPYNFGYAIRTIYASGADGIILTPRNWMSASGVVCRSSAGASEMLPCCIAEPANAVRMFKSASYKTAAAGIRDSVSAFDADLKKPLFLVVGGEKRDISRAVLDECDTIVRLDYGRKFSGSLSAASAASVLAYEVLRQNRK